MFKKHFKIDAIWYQTFHLFTFFLLPFSLLFWILSSLRRFAFDKGILKKNHFPVPVIVVGNITVGGTGKTPFVIELARFLKELGYHPGIVSRGVGGKKKQTAHWVEDHDSAKEVGDEALLLKQQTNCPVVISRDRVAAVNHLLGQSPCNIILSDDGLQHYRLGRSMEILMVDAIRQFGNQFVLPAGPLRETVRRKKRVDFVIETGKENRKHFYMTFKPQSFVSLARKETLPCKQFFPRKIHAVAGIGYPERFFDSLRALGFDVMTHPFPDHHLYQKEDFNFKDDLPIVMTEKDAVKCYSFADERYWYLKAEVIISPAFKAAFRTKLKSWEERECLKNQC